MTEDEQLAELAEQADTPLLRQMIGLRGELARERQKRLRDRVVALVAIVVVLLLWYGQRDSINRITAARSAARVALCQKLDDMRLKHNHFVDTTIAERQSIIDSTQANPNLPDAQKAQTLSFFQAQINNYRSDLLEIVDCDDPVAVSALFTSGG